MLLEQVKRGLRHVERHVPCQDHVLIRIGGDATVMAVADGHGGAPYVRAGLGARIACHVAQKVLLDERLSGAQYCDEISRRFDSMVKKHLSLRPLTREEQDKMEGQPHPGYAYGTTLMAVRITAADVWCFQLGDGEIHALDGAGRFIRLLSPGKQLPGETASMVLEDARRYMMTAQYPQPVGVVLMYTDGYACGASRPWPLVEAALAADPGAALSAALADGEIGDDQAAAVYVNEQIVSRPAFREGLAAEKRCSGLRDQLAALTTRKKELSGYLRIALGKLPRLEGAEKEQLMTQTRKRYAEYQDIADRIAAVEANIEGCGSEVT